MDSQQTRRADTQHPLTKRAPANPDSRGGKFIAHGIRPAAFVPMPKPLVTSQPPARIPRDVQARLERMGAVADHLLSRVSLPTPRLHGLRKQEENNRRQAIERPPGAGNKVIPSLCGKCGLEFPSKTSRNAHGKVCTVAGNYFGTPARAGKPERNLMYEAWARWEGEGGALRVFE